MKITLNLTPKEKKIFLKELEQHIIEIENSIVNVEQNQDMVQNMEQLFRSFHTIKGNAGIAEYDLLQKFSHDIESALQGFRNQSSALPEELIDLLYKAIDNIKILKKPISNPKIEVDESIIKEIMEEFKNLIKENTLKKEDKQKETNPNNQNKLNLYVFLKDTCQMPAVRLFQITKIIENSELEFSSQPTVDEIKKQEIELPLLICLPTDIPDEKLMQLISDIQGVDETLAIKKTIPLKQYPKIGKKNQVVQITQSAQEALQDVQINIKKLDGLINLLGEILIDRNKIAQNIMDLEEKYTLDPQVSELLDLANHLGKITYNLQTELLNIRTIPLSNIVGKYPRLIRELAKKVGKKIRLDITGQQVELDRLILKHLNDLIIHIIRNAVDHGIEDPAERKNNNKPETGLVKIEAYQKHNKAYFIITDDGKGIDSKKIRSKLLAKKLVDEETLKNLPNKEVIKYIFHPGFSTKDSVSEISGRGVGMDVVQNTIQKLGGQINIESSFGIGTTFKINLPLTLAIVHGLVTLTNGRIFIIPSGYVDEVVRCYPREIRIINKTPHLLLRENLIPIIKLKTLFYNEEFDIKKQKKLFIVIVNYNEKQSGILVDKLIGEEEIVIKNIDYAHEEYYIIHSATIMGTGDIGLILDIASLLEFVIMNRNKAPKQKQLVIESKL